MSCMVNLLNVEYSFWIKQNSILSNFFQSRLDQSPSSYGPHKTYWNVILWHPGLEGSRHYKINLYQWYHQQLWWPYKIHKICSTFSPLLMHNGALSTLVLDPFYYPFIILLFEWLIRFFSVYSPYVVSQARRRECVICDSFSDLLETCIILIQSLKRLENSICFPLP